MLRGCLFLGLAGSLLAPLAVADGPGPAERGRKALLTRPFTPGLWKLNAYEDAWKTWGQGEQPPADYAAAFRARYGLHPAPYDNGKYPMGLREGRGVFLGKGLAMDCMLCHAGSLLGQSYVGLGNSALDLQALAEDLSKAGGGAGKTPIVFSNVRGTSEAGNFAVFLLSFRHPDLKLHIPPRKIELRPHLCEDVPAWWLLKKKKTMYHTGTTPARSVRSLMQFMLVPSVSRATFDREEATFADIQAYLLSLSPPKYPYPIDRKLAKQGETIFNETCARCHGTYGAQWTYPSKIVPIDVIGTDRTRYEGFAREWGEFYNRSWFAQEKRPDGATGYPVQESAGYQAPPLDGIWATAPYFHNGSVPTVYGVLNSKSRPKIFTRSFRTGGEDYDAKDLGWKVRVLERGPDANLPASERRKVYDTTQPGRGNGGHTFGDDLTEEQRRAVIEYLKTL
jgi:mono/diheme cytochrome c family protein